MWLTSCHNSLLDKKSEDILLLCWYVCVAQSAGFRCCKLDMPFITQYTEKGWNAQNLWAEYTFRLDSVPTLPFLINEWSRSKGEWIEVQIITCHLLGRKVCLHSCSLDHIQCLVGFATVHDVYHHPKIKLQGMIVLCSCHTINDQKYAVPYLYRCHTSRYV